MREENTRTENNNNNSKKKQIIILSVIIVILLMYGFGSIYAYYQNSTEVSNNTNTSIFKNNSITITFDDNSDTITNLEDSKVITKYFKIENNDNLDVSLSLNWYELVNTYDSDSIKYSLSYSEEKDGIYKDIVKNKSVPVSQYFGTNKPMVEKLVIKAKDTYYYKLVVELVIEEEPEEPEKEENNNTETKPEQDFSTKVEVEDTTQKVLYKLQIDPNGGTWDSYTTEQTYLLNSGDTKTIHTPTREGYTFDGWTANGKPITLNANLFTMNLENVKLVANWVVNKYKITINPNGGTYNNSTDNLEIEAEYNSTTQISIPTKEGYQFTGWTVSSGKFDGTNLTLNVAEDVTLTANWVIGKYNYIVYHNQQSVDGLKYNPVSADTVAGEAEYKSTVTPDINTYKGFTSPTTKQDLVISSNPDLNIVNYNYTRNKYKLTIKPNGGTYNGKTTNTTLEMYYEAETTLDVPTKTGYTFANWTITSGELTDNKFKISSSNAEATANYTANTYKVTFDANGGTVDAPELAVTYDSTYGTGGYTLPTPTSTTEGAEFAGWFTSPSGGTQITEDSKVTIAEDHTLYAVWGKPCVQVQPIVQAVLNGETVDSVPVGYITAIATDDASCEKLYSTKDEYGTSYVYRGAVENNYVYFANFWWRIIRVNGDGTVRMIYDGTTAHPNGEKSTDRLVKTSQQWTGYYNDAKYAGYMFGGGLGTASSSKSAAITNTSSSKIKTELEKWYLTNIRNAGFHDYVADRIFCNERTTYSGPGYGKADHTEYITRRRMMYPSKYIMSSIACSTAQSYRNNRFTVDDATQYGNGKLTQPVGLITAFEAWVAGGTYYGVNTSYYLYKGEDYWTMSPSNLTGTNGSTGWYYHTRIRDDGAIQSCNKCTGGDYHGMVPVINIKAELAANFVGTGTMTNPYMINPEDIITTE